jgi:LPXTG-motif cell wall-anchored protein
MPSQQSIASATNFGSDKVSKYWPVIVAALNAEDIGQEPVLIAAAGTLKAELGNNFAPVSEHYNGDPVQYFEAKYGYQTTIGKKLGNVKAGDGYKYRGRGFLQLTGLSNYLGYGRRLGIDLASNPDLALDPYNAARIFAAYFKDRGVAAAANHQDWRAVRRLVNGGYNGWDAFIGVINKLASTVAGAVKPTTDTGATNPSLLAILGLTLLGLLGLKYLR